MTIVRGGRIEAKEIVRENGIVPDLGIEIDRDLGTGLDPDPGREIDLARGPAKGLGRNN